MDSDITKAKRDLRTLVNQRLAELTDDDRADASAAICAELEVLLQPSGTVLTFLPCDSEPDIDPFISTLLAHGKRVAGPRCDWGTGTFTAVKLRTLESVEVRRHSVREPLDGPAIDHSEISAVLVPGLAFDIHGGRLGRGSGFYDRFLNTLPTKVRRVGICFASQVVKSVPREEHDAPVNEIITENGRVFSDRSSG